MECGAPPHKCVYPSAITSSVQATFFMSSIGCFQCSGVCLVVISPLPASSPAWLTVGWTLIPSSTSKKKKKKTGKSSNRSLFLFSLSSESRSLLCLPPPPPFVQMPPLPQSHTHQMGCASSLPWPRWSHQALFPEWSEALDICRLSKVGVKRKINTKIEIKKKKKNSTYNSCFCLWNRELSLNNLILSINLFIWLGQNIFKNLVK